MLIALHQLIGVIAEAVVHRLHLARMNVVSPQLEYAGVHFLVSLLGAGVISEKAQHGEARCEHDAPEKFHDASPCECTTEPAPPGPDQKTLRDAPGSVNGMAGLTWQCVGRRCAAFDSDCGFGVPSCHESPVRLPCSSSVCSSPCPGRSGLPMNRKPSRSASSPMAGSSCRPIRFSIRPGCTSPFRAGRSIWP